MQGSIHDVSSLHWVYLQRSYNNVTPQIQKIVYSIVDFILVSNPERSPGSLQRLLLRYSTYRPWLFNALPFGGDRTRQGSYLRWIKKEWIQYADQQLAAATPPGSAQPAQDLQLLCTAERSNGAHLYLYDLQTDEFIGENIDGPFRLMYSLPDDDGVLLQKSRESEAAAGSSQIQIWRQGQPQDVTYPAASATLYGLENIADGMLFYTYNTRRRPPIRFAYLESGRVATAAPVPCSSWTVGPPGRLTRRGRLSRAVTVCSGWATRPESRSLRSRTASRSCGWTTAVSPSFNRTTICRWK